MINKIIVAGVCLCMVIACKKFVDLPAPVDQISANMVFTSDAKATNSVGAIYGQMINGGSSYFSKQQLSVVAGLSSDEISRFNSSSELTQIINNEMQASNSPNNSIWKSLYQTIYYSNACKEGLEKSISISSNVKTRLIAEVLFLRSFCYFYLINLYGDVPLVLTTNQEVNSFISRTETSIIYEQVLKDLLFAEPNLPDHFVEGERIRPTRWAAQALLARIYLYQRQWEKAKIWSWSVISSGLFSLPEPSSVFLKNSPEAIWQLRPQSGILPEIRETRPTGNVPKVYLLPAITSLFYIEDLRKLHWTGIVVNNGTTYMYPSKYKNVSSTVTEYYMLLRAAEQYLIRAEAELELGEHNSAIDDLNLIRKRAGLIGLPYSLTSGELRIKIEQERMLEFFCEFNHRWFDLKRTQRLGEVIGAIKVNWNSTDTLFPIPLIEIMRNPNMVQNNGY